MDMVGNMGKAIIYSFLGTDLDAGFRERRWKRWRPNVGIAASTGVHIDTLVLLHQPEHASLARRVREDALSMKSHEGFEVELKEVDFEPFDLASTFLMMDSLRSSIDFRPENSYLLSISTGTHIMQIASYKMVEEKRWPGLIAQCSRGEGLSTAINLIDLDLRKYDLVMARYRLDDLQGESKLKQGIVTLNPAFNTMVTKLQQVASKSRSPILLMGPTGAGKTAMARRLHKAKEDAGLLKGAFVEVNCATLRGDTVMSTLFGHKKGAFTGAQTNRDGLLKKANGGLLFLDEIGDLGLDEQAMLLHALEDKIFTPLGSDETVESNFQLIAGTNRDLLESVEQGTFRSDLLARINTWAFTMPGLRDRLEDIEPNITYELDALQKRDGVTCRFLPQALQRYLAFATSTEGAWTGNFRDLASSVERMSTLAMNGIIDVGVVDDELSTLKAAWRRASPAKAGSMTTSLERVLPNHSLNLFEQAQLNLVLSLCGEAKSYADLGRKVFGDDVGKNPSQRVRDFLIDQHGLSLEMVKQVIAEFQA